MPPTVKASSDLNTPVQYLKGIGPKRSAVLKDLGIQTVRDLLYYFPRDYLDLSRVEKIGSLRRLVNSGEFVTVIGTVRARDTIGRPPRQRFVIVLGDETGTISLIFFQSLRYYQKAFEPGDILAVSGKVTDFRNRPQIVHPSIDRLAASGDEESDFEGFLHTKGIVPKYSSSEGLRTVKLDTKGFRRVIRVALDEYLAAIQEWLPPSLLDENKFLQLPDALRSIHFPESLDALESSRHRLKFDELFSMQLLLALRRKNIKTEFPGISFDVESKLARQLVDSLPFKLTKAQVSVIKEIAQDMKAPKPMNRLLQGDVGSGKTIVALIAMLIAVDNGYQAAFMAPTEILAEQHYRTLTNFLHNIPANVRLLVSGQQKKLRDDVLLDIQRGSANIIVGTHALIQEVVDFAKLGFVVIDEQHRFGVSQRIALKEKGVSSHGHIAHADMLVMTATPIPRTLALTIYGDLDVSTITSLPSNRKAIKTTLKTESQHASVYQFLRDQIRQGRQAYIVYPLVEESEKLDLKAATEAHAVLRKEVFADMNIGLIHGRMRPEEKDSVMSSFKGKKVDILVATTVIEVGIDIPNASVMVIEHAERFGLSQLHQLRGRVGRGAEQSYCILMAPEWMRKLQRSSPTIGTVDDEQEEQRKTERRLKAMLDTNDGFKIAEIDLELRGPGDFFGTRQSGLPELQLANLLTDGELLASARQAAFELIDHDPHLRLPEHRPLRKHFEEHMRDALTFIQAG